MAYPNKNNTVYNMVLIPPQKPDGQQIESWTNKGDEEEIMELYEGWNDTVRNLLYYVPDGEVIEWTFKTHRPLPRWIENKCALIGDLCHPMLPYVAQGAAQVIEDAGVLTVALSLTDDVPTALGVYEAGRKSRGESIHNNAATTRKALHLPDGSEQEKRDLAIGRTGPNPDLWADHEWQDFMRGVDVMQDTMEKWDKLVAQVKGHHLGSMKPAVY